MLLAVGRWFPPGAPVSSTSFLHQRYDSALAVAEALSSNKSATHIYYIFNSQLLLIIGLFDG